MCGVVGLLLRDDALRPRLGELVTTMLCQASGRGPDAAGVGVYGDRDLVPDGQVAVSVLGATVDVPPSVLPELRRLERGPTTVFTAATDVATLEAAVVASQPEAVVIGRGSSLAVLKGTGTPADLADRVGLAAMTGHLAIGHTRMATESAVTPAHSHPFAVAPDFCLVHNGSFSNHASVRRELRAAGVEFDSDNDSEVGARYVAACLAAGDDLDKALLRLGERFDGFYTLVVTTADTLAVVRDPIACKPAVIAETPEWVAVASEFRQLAALPGIERATLTEPIPDEVYSWTC